MAAIAVPTALMMLRLPVPRSVLIMSPLLLVLIMGGSRLAFRAWKERRFDKRFLNAREPIFVLGADHAAVNLVKELARSTQWRVVGLFDDDAAKTGRQLHGVNVLGRLAGHRVVERAARRHAGDHRDAGSRARGPPPRAGACTQAGLKVLTVPSFDDLVSGRVTVSQLRHVELDDLLGRDPVTLDTGGLRDWLSGRVVMVTGAGGSIGAELARQIARFAPRRLVLLELNEYALYTIEQEFAEQHQGQDVVCAIGDVKDPARMEAGAAPLAAVRRVSRRGLQARAADGERERLAGGAQQRRSAPRSWRRAAIARGRREIRLHLDRQGRESHAA